MVTPARGGQRALHQQERGLPLARACRYLGVQRALVRYIPRRAPPAGLCARLRELAVAKPRWGSPRLTWRLRREGGRSPLPDLGAGG